MSKYRRVSSVYELYQSCELVEPPSPLEVGRIVRCGTLDHPRSSNGAVLLNADGSIVAWNFENPDLKSFFHQALEKNMTVEQRRTIEENIKKAKTALACKQAALFRLTARKAYAFYRQLDGCYANHHPYLATKKVKHTGAMRVTGVNKLQEFFGYSMPLTDPVLVIPLTDGQRIQSLQFIDANGEKRFLNNGKKKGCYWLSQWRPEEPQRISITEGVATALSVKEHLEKTDPKTPQLVVAAMDCGNLVSVALNVRKKFPQAEICIFADNDRSQAGLKAALETAKVLQNKVKIYLPQFSSLEVDVFKEQNHDVHKVPTDFNDKAGIGLEEPFDLKHSYIRKGFER